jgi:hypothetical protein
MSRKAIVTKEIENILADQMYDGRTRAVRKRIRTKDAKRLLERMIKQGGLNKDTMMPGDSALQKTIARVYSKLNKAASEGLPLDEPWSVGCCIKCDIPANIIPAIILIQKKRIKIQNPLTIREARWIATLSPVLNPILQTNNNTNQTLGNEDIFLQIACSYARAEQISELAGDSYPNTSNLDNLYLIKEDISFEALMDGFVNTTSLKKDRDESVMFLKHHPFTAEDMEPMMGKLSQNEIDLINEYFLTSASSKVGKREWKKQHPEILEKMKKSAAAYFSRL